MSTLHLRLVDPYGDVIVGDMFVQLQNKQSGSILRARVPSGNALIAIPGGAVYQVTVNPLSHLPAAAFVTMPAEGEIRLDMTCPIDSGKVLNIVGPKWANLDPGLQKLLNNSPQMGLLKGEGLYDSFDELRVAALLNIFTKCNNTAFESGRSVWSYVTELCELRQDRCFVGVQADLRGEVKNTIGGLFSEVSSSLHHPPVGYEPMGSFKTPDHYGNLQVTFFENDGDWVADIDIDDAGGVMHIWQVVRNHATGQPTHPYNIHQILLASQKLDTGYRLKVA